QPHHSAMIAAIVLRGAAIVAEEQQIHLAARGDARDLLVEVGRAVIRVADPGARYPPEVVGMQERQVGSQVDGLALGHRRYAPMRWASAPARASVSAAGRRRIGASSRLMSRATLQPR